MFSLFLNHAGFDLKEIFFREKLYYCFLIRMLKENFNRYFLFSCLNWKTLDPELREFMHFHVMFVKTHIQYMMCHQKKIRRQVIMNENSIDALYNNGEVVESKATETVAMGTESNILSLVEEVTKKYDEIVEMCQTVDNKGVHGLLSKVERTNMALINLRIHRKKNPEYFSEKNYTTLCKLVAVIDKIRENIVEISKGYKVEINRDVNNEIDSIIQLLDLKLKVPFSSFLPHIEEVDFLPLVREITKIHNEIIEVYQTAEYNKETCWSIMKKVEIVDIPLRNLKDNRKENSKYFSKRNYINLCSLVNVIEKMRKFVAKISYYEFNNINEDSKYLKDEFDSIVQLLNLNSSAATVCTGIETASKVEVLFAKFLPLIEKVNKVYNEIDNICMTTQYNKKICEIMLGRVRIVDKDVKTLKIRNLGFFSEKNYNNFSNLISVIDKIHQYLAKISQLKDYSNNYEDIEFFKLDDEFKTTLQLLQPFLIVNFDTSNKKIDVEEVKFKLSNLSYLY
jgi:hypothetical protein